MSASTTLHNCVDAFSNSYFLTVSQHCSFGTVISYKSNFGKFRGYTARTITEILHNSPICNSQLFLSQRCSLAASLVCSYSHLINSSCTTNIYIFTAQQGVTTHVVRVGSLSGDLTFMPSTLAAAAGDMIQFQFAPKNHSVVQSTFDQPCQPSKLHSNITGLYSGYIPVAANSPMTATWTIKVNDTKPLWLYCSQAKHCQNGMVMVVNP